MVDNEIVVNEFTTNVVMSRVVVAAEPSSSNSIKLPLKVAAVIVH